MNSPRKRRLWVMRMTALVAAPVLVFGLLEVTLRLADYGYPTAFLIRNGDYLESNDRFGLRIFPKAMVRTPCKLRIPARKSPGTYRVLILGGSAAMGFP